MPVKMPVKMLSRFVLAQAVAVCYAVAVGAVVLRRAKFRGGGYRAFEAVQVVAREDTMQDGDHQGTMEGFPMWRLAAMALLDMLHLVPMIVAAADVAPTLTVLLLQCSAPYCLAVAAFFCGRWVRASC